MWLAVIAAQNSSPDPKRLMGAKKLRWEYPHTLTMWSRGFLLRQGLEGAAGVRWGRWVGSGAALWWGGRCEDGTSGDRLHYGDWGCALLKTPQNNQPGASSPPLELQFVVLKHRQQLDCGQGAGTANGLRMGRSQVLGCHGRAQAGRVCAEAQGVQLAKQQCPGKRHQASRVPVYPQGHLASSLPAHPTNRNMPSGG